MFNSFFPIVLVIILLEGKVNQNISYFTFHLTHDGGSYNIETSPFICSANQWTCIYKTGAFVMKELKYFFIPLQSLHNIVLFANQNEDIVLIHMDRERNFCMFIECPIMFFQKDLRPLKTNSQTSKNRLTRKLGIQLCITLN